jgi:hypothetical protein
MQSRIQSGTGYKVSEIEIPRADWMVLNELAQDLPIDLRLGDEAGALNWLEAQGAKYSYALSPELHESMNTVCEGKDSSVLLITTEDPGNTIGSTPLDHLKPIENLLYQPDMCRGILVGAFALHGYGYTSQQYGVIFNNMVVAESQRSVEYVASNKNELGFHTEDSAFAEGDDGGMSPDILSLHYFRNQEGVSTPVSTPNFSRLSDSMLESLRQEQFVIPNSPAQGGDPNQTNNKVAVIFGDTDNPSVRYNANFMPTPNDPPEVKKIVEAFTNHLHEQATILVMQPGDILFINNRQTVHGKGKHGWEAPKGKGRWQRRLALSKDLGRLEPFMEDSNSRIVSPDLYLKVKGSR